MPNLPVSRLEPSDSLNSLSILRSDSGIAPGGTVAFDEREVSTELFSVNTSDVGEDNAA